MNRLILIISYFVSPLIIWGQTFISENDTTAITEYIDGKQWVYRNIDDLVVGMSTEEFKDDYGKYYQVGFYVSNYRDSTLTFNPEYVLAHLLSNKGDTISLEVYSNEKFQKKIKKAQRWAMALEAFSAGLNNASAGYSTTYSTSVSNNGNIYSSVSRTYNPSIAYQANMATNMKMQTLKEKMDNDRKVSEQGYLKLNTIHPGDAIVGYMNIKHKKGNILFITLKIGDSNFSYSWDVEKKKKKK